MAKSRLQRRRPAPKVPEPTSPANLRRRKTRWLFLLGALGLVLALGGYAYSLSLSPADRQLAWGNIKGLLGLTTKVSDELPTEAPPLNPNEPPGPVPGGMVWIPGGEFYMGHEELTENHLFDDAVPIHKVYVDGFWMDKTEVTNAQWQKFVEATGYKTVAEQKPDPKDFPAHIPREKIPTEPCSICFAPPEVSPEARVPLDDELLWWEPRKGADWQHPEGPASTIKGREKHPVVHICYLDAVAYCNWAKMRLPTEAEWEFAARGGLDRKTYCWGDELKPDGKWMANSWQGRFPNYNSKEDGFEGTAPVGSYPANGYGLFDMAGNVWEWCSDWYQPDYYGKSPPKNPKGPIASYDPNEPGLPKRVQRGGSFLCSDEYCRRYLPGARGKGEETSAASHIGFRCVRDPEVRKK